MQTKPLVLLLLSTVKYVVSLMSIKMPLTRELVWFLQKYLTSIKIVTCNLLYMIALIKKSVGWLSGDVKVRIMFMYEHEMDIYPS